MLAPLTLHLHLHLPACASLKEKRGRIKPLMARLRPLDNTLYRTYNLYKLYVLYIGDRDAQYNHKKRRSAH